MDVPSHLLQPLSIDTNIIYDLDTTMFPGLDNPQHMHQPALLVASPEARQSWLSALKYDDVSDDLLTDDLFDLIEDCTTETFHHTVNSDSTLYQNVCDDILDSISPDQSEDDASLADDMWLPIDCCATSLYSSPGQQMHPSSPSWGSSCASSTYTMSLKRKRESENMDLAKRSKLADIINYCSYVHSGTYDICVRGF